MKFDKITTYIDDLANCSMEKYGYCIDFFNTHFPHEGMYVSMKDLEEDLTLLLYERLHIATNITTERLSIDNSLYIYDSAYDRYNDSFLVNDDKIFLVTMYLQAYKSQKNINSIPKEMIDKIYELLTYIHHDEQFKIIEGAKTCEEKMFITTSL